MGASELCSPRMAHPNCSLQHLCQFFLMASPPFFCYLYILLPYWSSVYSALYSTLPIYSIITVSGFSTSLSTVKAQCLPVSRCFLRSCCSPLACHLKFSIFNLLKIFIAYVLGTWLLLLAEGIPTAHGILLHKDIFIQVCWAHPL